MSENVKINIFERDNTSPAGSGIDSTDIAFIPGFSSLAAAPKNVPTLVTSTRQFEQLFGSKPRVLTTRDVKKYSDRGFIAGDYDRSYVFAKELLYQGMPVVYSNLVLSDFYSVINLTTPTICDYKTLTTLPNKNITVEPANDENASIIVTVADNYVDVSNIGITCKTNVDVPYISENVDGRTTFELSPVIENADGSLTDLECKIDKITVPTTANIKYNKLSDYQYEFINTDTKKTTEGDDSTVQVSVTFAMKLPKLNPNEIKTIVVRIFKPEYSILDCFYGQTPVVKDQYSTDYIADKSIYSVKYITSGGYPSIINEAATSSTSKSFVAKSIFATEMLNAAATRGDAVALIDYQFNPDETKVFSTDKDSGSFYAKMHACVEALPNPEFGAAMYPWATYNCASTLSFADSSIIRMPASFAYLMCVAKAIKSSPNWLAMAGVSRGLVPAINTLCVPGNVISNTIAEEMQPKFGVEGHKISINTITNIRPYGLTLWGNRTLKPVDKEGTVALNFLNTRNMLSDIKKLLYTTAKSCMFEQNSADLWIKFKNGIEPLLRRLKAGNGISDYQIVRGTTKYNGDPLTKGEIAAVIKVYPMYAVEFFELAVEINDEDVTVS